MRKIGRLIGMFILLISLVLALTVMLPLLLCVDLVELIRRLFKKKGKYEFAETD